MENNVNLKEFHFNGLKINGFVMLILEILLVLCFVAIVVMLAEYAEDGGTMAAVCGVLLLAVGLSLVILPIGFMQIEPNEARVMVFFGKYKGTFSSTGFFWVNPFYVKKKVSLRARNLDVAPIKVNDKVGNPIMVGLVLVWKLKDTYKAMFEIDSQTIAGGTGKDDNSKPQSKKAMLMNAFENFVQIQSDAALRHVAAHFNYDNNEGVPEEITLRSGGEEVNEILESTLNERLRMAGIEVIEARINYLAYAPEIAAVMLRRQQASAVISAREKIVDGAVSMVKMALDKLSEEKVVELDEERKASMVSNLLVVLCADESAQPVVNAGSLY